MGYASIQAGESKIANVYQGADLVWQSFSPVAAMGGTITEVDGYKIHTFTASSDFFVTSGGDVEYFAIGGGGGSGGTSNNASNGGNAGRVAAGTMTVGQGALAVVVGAGGARGPGWSTTSGSGPGGASSLGGVIAAGGAGSPNTLCCPSESAMGQGGAAVPASDVAVVAEVNVWTPGVTTEISGTPLRFGDTYWRGPVNTTQPNGAANTGNGGRGTWSSANRQGATGGSGVVIVRYPI